MNTSLTRIIPQPDRSDKLQEGPCTDGSKMLPSNREGGEMKTVYSWLGLGRLCFGGRFVSEHDAGAALLSE